MSTSRRRRSAVLVLALAAQAALITACGGGSDSSATSTAARQPPASGEVQLQKVGDFDQPDYVTQPPGSDDLYVVERQGSVRIVRGGEVVSTPALDIRDRVTSDGEEQGLLSIAFPPGLPELA